MIDNLLTENERRDLLRVARESIESVVTREKLLKVDVQSYSASLQEEGASFVTLTKAGALCGCIGTLEPYQPLVQDVCEHAAAAAVEDYRFAPVRPEELTALMVEISCLTVPKVLAYRDPTEIPGLLRPSVDGVVLRDGVHRATFLPQVWEKIPDPEAFLNHLCWKMGAPENYWRIKRLEVLTYQVEEFSEAELG